MARRRKESRLSIVDVIVLSILIHWGLLFALSQHLPKNGQRAIAKEDSEAVHPAPVAVLKPSTLTEIPPPTKAQAKVIPVIPTPPPPPKPKETKPEGQVVDILPPKDSQSPDEAKFLAAHNSRVKKEMVARKNAPPTPKMTKSDRRVISGGDDANGSRQGRIIATQVPKKAKRKSETKNEEGAKRQKRKKTRPGKRVRKSPRRAAKKKAKRGASLPSGEGRFSRPESGGENHSTSGSPQTATSDALPGPENWQALLPTLGAMDQKEGDGSIDHLPDLDKGDRTFLNTREYRHAWFFNRVKRSVRQTWHAAQRHREQDPRGRIYGVRDRMTVVDVTLTSDGALKQIEVSEDSGVSVLDEAAVQAFEQAEPFPNPPKELQDPDGHIRFKFGFFLEIRGGGFRVFRPY